MKLIMERLKRYQSYCNAELNESFQSRITKGFGLDGNAGAIDLTERLGHPTVTCIIAGRNVIIRDYMNQWDGIVMCYLPGSEGDGVTNVLTEKAVLKERYQCATMKRSKISERRMYCFRWGMD